MNATEERINWYRTPLTKEERAELNRRSDGPGLLQCLSLCLLYMLTATGCWMAWNGGSWALIIPAFLLHGTVICFAGPPAAVHELSHGTPFKTQFLNELFIRLFSFLSWSNYVFFRASHAQHHQVTLYAGRDQEIVPPLVFKPLSLLWATTSFQKPGMHLRHCFGQLKGERETRLFPESNPKKQRELFAWARILVLGHLILAGVFIAIGQLILIPILLLPLYGSCLATLCTFPQHAGMQADINDFRYSCRSMTLNPLAAFLYWNMQYHVEHHMYPAVPFWKLPRLNRLVRHDMPEPCNGFAAAWREIVQIEKSRKKDPDYQFNPFERGNRPEGQSVNVDVEEK